MREHWIPIDISVSAGTHKAAEPTDPYMPTAYAVPTPGYDGLGAMGRAFVEEFALLGWSPQRLERMFRTPSYAAAHAVFRQYGPEYVTALITDVLGTPPQQAEPSDPGVT
ncbi:MAG: hypothetical protein GY720_08670 [bacterium]|nr:hypothetical protein [bacterium]